MIPLKITLLGMALCLSVSKAAGQAASDPVAESPAASALTSVPAPKGAKLPIGLLLRRISDFSSWQINFNYAKDKEKASPEHPAEYGFGLDADFLPAPLRRITLTRTRPRYLAVSVDVKGNVLEQSSDGVQEFLHNPRSGQMMSLIRDDTTPLRICDFAKVDFPDMEWVSKETFTGIQSIGEIECLVFQKEGKTAWIDAQTRFPVLWRKEGETRTFQQLPPPTGMVQLSRKAQELSEEYQRALHRLLKPRPRGG